MKLYNLKKILWYGNIRLLTEDYIKDYLMSLKKDGKLIGFWSNNYKIKLNI